MYYFALLLTAATSLLILAGGLVTSHEAGLAVPDWPLSYGQAFPPMVGNVFWEHGHRMIAGTVGILTLILALWIQFKETRRGLKKLAWTAMGTVVLQAVLGGLTVLFLLPAPISIFHACLAQIFFCLLISIVYFLSPASVRPEDCKGRCHSERSEESLRSFGLRPQDDRVNAQDDRIRLKRLTITTVALLFLQLILGATIRHTAGRHGIIPHVVVAFAVVTHIFMLVSRIMKMNISTELIKSALAIGLLTVFQFFLGIGAFVLRHQIPQGYAPSTPAIFFTAIHQTNGALILGLAVLISLMVSR